MKKLIAITLFVSSLAYGQSAKELYIEAVSLIESKKYINSLEIVDKCITQLGSSNALLESLKVKCYYELRQYENAEKSLHEFFKYKAADYLIEEMLEYAKLVQKAKAKEMIYLAKTKESEFLSVFEDLESGVFEVEEKKLEKEIAETKAAIVEAKKQQKQRLDAEDKVAYQEAVRLNTVESFNRYLENPKYSLFKGEAQEKVEYLMFVLVAQSNDVETAAALYKKDYPNSRYIDRLELVIKYQDVRDLKISSHKNGDNFVQSGNRYIHGLDAIQALKVLENAINLEVLEIGYYELNKDVIVDLSLLKNLKRITLQRAVPHLIFNAADKLDNVKTLYIDSYKSSNSSLKHFKGLTSIECLHLGHINKSNRNDILELLDNNERLVNVAFKHFEIETGSRDETYDNHMDAVLQKLCKQKYLRKLEIINAINRIPENFGGLLLLEELDLWGNKLKELPNSFGTFKNLRILHLAYNDFEVLPDVISNLENLEILELSKNYSLSKLPSDFGRLKKLKSLNLAWTRVDVLPQSFLELESLTRLDIYEAMDGDDKKEGKRILKEFQKQHKALVVVDKFKEHHSDENKAVFNYI
jgi:Leucine-rich repeat (LRR) protein